MDAAFISYFREYFAEHCGDKYDAERYESEPGVRKEEVSDEVWRVIDELFNRK